MATTVGPPWPRQSDRPGRENRTTRSRPRIALWISCRADTLRQTDPVDYEIDDDPTRIQSDVVWQWLSTAAYWGRWRTRADIDGQIAGAWRVVGAYLAGTGAQVGFARAVSDGIGFAYLADVFVLDDHRGAGLGKRIVERMIDAGPGRDMRWVLFTGDAHELYRQYGFTEPDATAMVRPSRQG